MVHRKQAALLLVVGGLVFAAVGVAALSGTGIPATIAARVSGVEAPASGIPSKISIGAAAPPGSGAAPGVGTAAGRSGGGPATVVPPEVYTYPADDHGHDGSGRSSGDGSGGHHS
jgi:hypothetical protein